MLKSSSLVLRSTGLIRVAPPPLKLPEPVKGLVEATETVNGRPGVLPADSREQT